MLLGISLDMKNDQTTVTQQASFFPAKAIWDFIKGENKLSSTNHFQINGTGHESDQRFTNIVSQLTSHHSEFIHIFRRLDSSA